MRVSRADQVRCRSREPLTIGVCLTRYNLLLQFIVLKIKLVEAKGRRTKVVGTVEDLSGKLLVEAE